MTTIQIVQLPMAKQHETSINDVLKTAASTLSKSSSVQGFVIGTELKDDNALQVVIQDSETKNGTDTKLLAQLKAITTTSPTSFHLTLNNPPFAAGGPANAPVVEYVQSWFPASKATPAFRKQIENDFLKFKDIFDREAKTDAGRAYGWVDEELEKDDVDGGKAVSFIVVTGWHKYEDFEFSTQTESFKEAIPTLMAWGAPHRMWFVERKEGSQA